MALPETMPTLNPVKNKDLLQKKVSLAFERNRHLIEKATSDGATIRGLKMIPSVVKTRNYWKQPGCQ